MNSQTLTQLLVSMSIEELDAFLKRTYLGRHTRRIAEIYRKARGAQ